MTIVTTLLAPTVTLVVYLPVIEVAVGRPTAVLEVAEAMVPSLQATPIAVKAGLAKLTASCTLALMV